MIDATFDKINRFIPKKWQWILSHSGFRKYFKNTGWMMIARILSLAISFVTTIFVARSLGPENYGQLSYAVSFVGLFSFIATLGIDQILFRDLVKYPEKRSTYLGSSFLMRVLAGLVTMIICCITTLLINKDVISNILIFIIASTFIFNAFQIIIYEFQARVQSKYPSLISLIISITLNILKIIIIILGKGIIYLALILLLESILYAVLYLYIYKKKLKESVFAWRYDSAVAKKILHDSWPLIVSNAFATIYARVDQVMIKNMIDASAVGLYDAAVRLTEVWYFIPGIIVSSLFPAIINAKKESDVKYVKRLRYLFLFLLFFSITISVITSVLAKPIVSILYGPAFLGSIAVLQVYIWSNVGTAIGSLCNSYLIAENYRRIVLFSSFISMTANIILNFFMISRFGIVGAAWATFISYILMSLSLFLFKESREMVYRVIRNN
ncbi:flippase [Candidatus Falkowbacteria bacterium]|jgi:O-antigen/teichoic acid export membrane protein|nr:flippase [Candidatus Falkowbacteria bacterium]